MIWDSGNAHVGDSRKDGSNVRKLIAAMVLGAFLVAVIGCGGTTPSGTKPPAEKKDDKKEGK
jgi:hypothetical protein